MTGAIFDSHSHYDDEAFDDDRDILLSSMKGNNVGRIMSCGCDIKSITKAQQISEKFDFVYFSAGFHPENEKDITSSDLVKIENFLKHEKCKAVGEIGLDYYWKENPPKEIQRGFFEEQILIAKKHNLPVIVHDRDAHRDTFDILQKHQPMGVIHCYSGSIEMMREYIKLGFYIGFNGVVTFKNAKKPLEVACEVPLDRLLLETDAPYLAPIPYRGKRCDSSMIASTAQTIADKRGISVNEVLSSTMANACELFNIK